MLPAITHVDGTGPLQTVRHDTNPRYHKLIATSGQATGVPVVLKGALAEPCDSGASA